MLFSELKSDRATSPLTFMALKTAHHPTLSVPPSGNILSSTTSPRARESFITRTRKSPFQLEICFS